MWELALELASPVKAILIILASAGVSFMVGQKVAIGSVATGTGLFSIGESATYGGAGLIRHAETLTYGVMQHSVAPPTSAELLSVSLAINFLYAASGLALAFGLTLYLRASARGQLQRDQETLRELEKLRNR